MKKERYLRIYDLHSWSGIVLGLFVFIVSFTGTVALFEHELKSWEDPAKRLSISVEPITMMPILEEWIAANAQEDVVRNVSFRYPDFYRPYYHAAMNTKAEGSKLVNHFMRWDTHTGEPLVNKESALTEWILDFHRDLMWPDFLGGRTAGRGLVGVVGIVLLLSIITGIITHTKIIKEFFTLRVKRSIHLKWQDMHKVVGLWSLPFSTMIAFTGAFLGLIVILAPIAAVLAFKGDTQALIDAAVGQPTEPSGVAMQMYSVDDVARYPFPNSSRFPYLVNISNWGDENAEHRLLYHSATELSRTDFVYLNSSDGHFIRADSPSTISASNRMNNAITPLHYGTFGGIWLKLLYAIMGVLLCIVTATGLMVWLERRLKSNKGKKKPAFYHRLGRLTIGVTLGFPIATIAIFYLDKLYRYLFVLLALGCLLLPLTNTITTGANFIVSLSGEHAWAWVDLNFLLLGLVLLITSYCLPSERMLEPRLQRNSAAD